MLRLGHLRRPLQCHRTIPSVPSGLPLPVGFAALNIGLGGLSAPVQERHGFLTERHAAFVAFGGLHEPLGFI